MTKKQDDFSEASANLIATQTRMDKLLVARAKELYPNYDRFPVDDNEPGFEGGSMTQAECRKSALESYRKKETADETLARWKRDTKVLRTVYLTPRVDNDLRVIAFRTDRKKNDLIEEAVTIYLAALKNDSGDA